MKISTFFTLSLFARNKKAYNFSYLLLFVLLILQHSLYAQSISKKDLLQRQKKAVDKTTLKKISSPPSLSGPSLSALCSGFTLQPVDAATNSLSQIIQSLVGPGVSISNIQTNLPASSDIYGSFSCATSVIGIEQGLILTSGSLANVKGPNAFSGASRSNGLPGNALLNAIGGSGADAAVVSFNITPLAKTLTFNYVFASEEYNDYVGSGFNDAFGFFISGPGIVGTKNIALLPGLTTPVTINNVNKGRSGSPASNPQYYINNDIRTLPTIPQAPDPFRYANLEYDGLTVVLPVTVTVIPGQTYTLTLAVQDVGDDALDSGVFIEGGSITSTTDYYSKASGDLHNVLTWGENMDGSGPNPPDFGAGKTFHLVNRVPTYTMTANWTVGGRLDIPAGSQLRINGYTFSIADLISTGTLFGSLTSNLIVTGENGDAGALNFAAGGGLLNNLTINRAGTSPSATVASALNIYGVLTLSSGLLNTGNFITLKSNASGTARVAPVTAGSISGNVTVERYIPARRAWRIMSAPVGGSQTINAGWQEGATTSSATPNPNPGFGTYITEGTTNGFDHNPLVAMPSVKKYVSASDSWVPLGNTNSTLINGDAYLLFVRGDRSVSLGYNTVTPNNTVLRATGPLKVGDQTFPVSASGFTAIPNPFASPINFATITRSGNVPNNFYLWDPKLGGEFGVGGYVLVSSNGMGGYDVTPAPVSPESQLIQSGQGFMVHAIGGSAGSLTIRESDKSPTAATNVFRGNNNVKNLRINLQKVNADNTVSIVDEVLTSYNSGFSNRLDEKDALKLSNINENLSIVREGQQYMLERRSEITESDTIQLKVWNTDKKKYILEFNPVNLTSSTLSAVLVDKFMHTTTPISLSEVSRINFTAHGDVSSGSDRFMIVISSAVKSQPITKSGAAGIWAYPNPINGRNINLQLIDQPGGTYNITLLNSLGQQIYQSQVKYAGGTLSQTLQFPKKLNEGMYQLKIANGKSVTNIKVLSN